MDSQDKSMNSEKRYRSGRKKSGEDLDQALSADPYQGSAQYGEGGYYQERARPHIQKDYGSGQAGEGPYSDEQLTEAVRESISRQIRLDDEDIQVSVKEGEVTLRGQVDSQYAKMTAEKAAGEVEGIATVHNLLELDDPRRTGADRSRA